MSSKPVILATRTDGEGDIYDDERWMAACHITLSEVKRGQEGVSEGPLAYCSQERLRQRSPDGGGPANAPWHGGHSDGM